MIVVAGMVDQERDGNAVSARSFALVTVKASPGNQ